MQLLNIGCGSTFHKDWDNLDMFSDSPYVRAHDLRKGLPYPDCSCHAVYSSHLLEHLKPNEASKLLSEMYRVLSPGGIVRLAVPDLESVARNYLAALEAVQDDYSPVKEANYDWMMLELYDQTVRCFNGGEMGVFLSKQGMPNKEFVIKRVGFEADNYWGQKNDIKAKTTWEKISSKTLSQIIRRSRITMAKLIVGLIAGNDVKQAFAEGVFRDSGEIHQWMYDRFSLGRILHATGFREIRVYAANESRIPHFDSYELEVINGRIRKPDSLFMEGIKL